MVLSVKAFLFVLSTWAAAQVALNPPDCTLECVDRALKSSSCAQASGGLRDPSAVPCLCGDTAFLIETVDCVLNSGECRNAQEQQRSFTYAYGLCDSAGVTLPGASPSELPSALGVSSSSTPSATTTAPTTSDSVTVIEETVTTNLTVDTSIACPVPSGNLTYIVVVNDNVTQTTMPNPTVSCGNTTKTMKVTTTRKSTSTKAASKGTRTTMSTTGPGGPSASDEGAAGRAGVQIGSMMAFVGALMWLV